MSTNSDQYGFDASLTSSRKLACITRRTPKFCVCEKVSSTRAEITILPGHIVAPLNERTVIKRWRCAGYGHDFIHRRVGYNGEQDLSYLIGGRGGYSY
jgi:hypothetical protein